MKNATISGYITNLGKYNEGQLIGEWVEFPITKEEAAAVLARIGISDEPDENGEYYEEYFFTDWDANFYGVAYELSEYMSISEANEIAENLEKYSVELAEAVIGVYSLDDLLENEPDDYILYDASNSEELGEMIAESTGDMERIPSDLLDYFNFEEYGEQYALDSNGDFTADGKFIEYIG